MSVIPFVLNGSSKTVVENSQEYVQAGEIEGKVIFIRNLQRSQLIDTRSSNVTYDLRVGDEYRDHRDTNKTELPDGEGVRLDPGAAVIIETMEEVGFPKSRFGHIVPKVTLLQQGISNTSSKIDPGYRGNLLITVFNLGKKTVFLKKGEPFCTLYVLDVGPDVIAYDKKGKKLPGSPKPKNLFVSITDYLERNSTLLNVLLTLLTAVLTVVTIVSTILEYRQTVLPKDNPSQMPVNKEAP
jgi:dCTP deaminase